MTKSKIQLYISKETDMFGNHDYYGYLDGKQDVISGLCDKFEVIKGDVLLYFHGATTVFFHHSIVDVFLDCGEDKIKHILNYQSFNE